MQLLHKILSYVSYKLISVIKISKDAGFNSVLGTPILNGLVDPQMKKLLN